MNENQGLPLDAGKKENRFVKRFDTIFAFLSLEVIGLLLFSFGGYTGQLILKFVAALLLMLGFDFLLHAYGKATLKRYALGLLPLWILFLLLSFGRFWLSYQGNVGTYFLFGLVEALGYIGFFGLGLLLRSLKKINRDVMLLAILGSLSAFVLLTGIYSLSRYGFFYASIHKGEVYYFDGVVFPIDTETKFLNGFTFQEVALGFGKIPAGILCASGVGLFFLNPKTEKKRFFVLLGFALLGFLDLLFVPYVRMLILEGAVYLFALFVFLVQRFIKTEKTKDTLAKTVFFVLVGIAFIGVGALFLDAFTGVLQNAGIPKVSNFLKNPNSLFGKIERAILDVFYNGAERKDLGQLDFLSILFGYDGSGSVKVNLTASFEFNVLWQDGLPAFLLLVYLIFFFFRRLYRFWKEGELDFAQKAVILGFLAFLFLDMSLLMEELPYRHTSPIYVPSARSLPFYFTLFLLGFAYPLEEKKEEKEHA